MSDGEDPKLLSKIITTDGKGKKPSQGPSTDSDAKKKKMKCHYCKKKEHVKSEYRKLKADQAAGTVFENKRVEGSKTQTAKVAATTEESVIHLFMAREATSDLASRWIIDSGATSPMTSRKEWFINYSPFRTPISIGLGNNSIIKAVRSESVIEILTDSDLTALMMLLLPKPIEMGVLNGE